MDLNCLQKVTESELTITEKEKKDCKTWFHEHVVFAGTNGQTPAYDFCYGTKRLSESLGDWSFCHNESVPHKDGEVFRITAVNSKNKLWIEVEATLYEQYAACEWTVYLKNTKDTRSSKISYFSALNESFSAENGELFYARGCQDTAQDFKLCGCPIAQLPLLGKRFTGVDGRSSERYLPFFNVHTDDVSFVCGIGWSGQWYTRFYSKYNGRISVDIRQQYLNAELLSGEEIRSPSVCLCFYQGAPIKGFNAFRSYLTNCIYPKEISQFVFVEPDSCDAPVEGVIYPDDIKTNIEILKKHGITNYDYIWIDAIWFPRKDDWSHGTGNWTVDRSFYPQGLRAISDYLKSQGKKLLLWYDPEVVYRDTELWCFGKTHEKYMIDIGKTRAVWNYADEDAFDYICKHIDSSIKDNGVSCYRQDFTIAPLEYWREADKKFYGGRIGICENHYITNMYCFLDYLRENNKGLIVDNCASGGKRLDFEMCHRSVPLWRTDYNCSNHADLNEATQCQTLGLSLWFPLSSSDNGYAKTRYDFRSQLTSMLHIGALVKDENPECFKLMRDYEKIKGCMTGYFFPLTKFSVSDNDMLAVQYYSPAEHHGAAAIYVRKNVQPGCTSVKLNGLAPNANYTVEDIDAPELSKTVSGKFLMEKGIELEIDEAPKAYFLLYHKVDF